MKKSLLLLLFIPLVSFGQNFDYNDLKDIKSLKQFKRFAFENEFVKISADDYDVTYAKRYNKEEELAEVWSYYTISSNLFSFQLAKNNDGSSNDSFESVLEQVKKNCTFYDFKEDGYGSYKKEFICYTCPGSAFTGKIGFARDDKNDYIETFSNFN
tara:strand:+ start:40 stop:507 length:468 start_codon:yes stop_codon:yes gene_type:complete